MLLALHLAGCAASPTGIAASQDTLCMRAQQDGQAFRDSIGEAAALCHLQEPGYLQEPDLSGDPDMQRRAVFEHVAFVAARRDPDGVKRWYRCRVPSASPATPASSMESVYPASDGCRAADLEPFALPR